MCGGGQGGGLYCGQLRTALQVHPTGLVHPDEPDAKVRAFLALSCVIHTGELSTVTSIANVFRRNANLEESLFFLGTDRSVAVDFR